MRRGACFAHRLWPRGSGPVIGDRLRCGDGFRLRFDFGRLGLGLALDFERDAEQPAGDREDELVDLQLVEDRQYRLEAAGLIARRVRVRADGDTDAAVSRLAQEPLVGVEVALLLLVRVVAIEKARVELDRHPALAGGREHPIFVLLELRRIGPRADDGRDVEVADDVAGEPFDRVDQRAHVELPQLIGADRLEVFLELGVVERPGPVLAVDRMRDRDEVHRPDHRVGTHRVDDVLRVGTRARIVVDLGPDRVAHPAPQPFADDGGMANLDARRLGGPVQVAGLRELERAPHEIDRRRILEREVVHVVGDHEETRISAAAGVIEP